MKTKTVFKTAVLGIVAAAVLTGCGVSRYQSKLEGKGFKYDSNWSSHKKYFKEQEYIKFKTPIKVNSYKEDKAFAEKFRNEIKYLGEESFYTISGWNHSFNTKGVKYFSGEAGSKGVTIEWIAVGRDKERIKNDFKFMVEPIKNVKNNTYEGVKTYLSFDCTSDKAPYRTYNAISGRAKKVKENGWSCNFNRGQPLDDFLNSASILTKEIKRNYGLDKKNKGGK